MYLLYLIIKGENCGVDILFLKHDNFETEGNR